MRCLLVLFHLFCINLLFAQENLVVNGSFEIYKHCPSLANHDLDSIQLSGWTYHNSPDYFHTCGDAVFGVPNNFEGKSKPHHGEAYIGMVVLMDNGFSEQLTNQLAKPLKAGSSYTISFYYKPSKLSSAVLKNMHTYFSARPPKIGEDFFNDSEKPEVTEVSPVKTKISWFGGWKKYTIKYTAKGGERFLTIGLINVTGNSEWKFEDLTAKKKGNTRISTLRNMYLYLDDIQVIEIK